jgi:uncharacterized membrane protein
VTLPVRIGFGVSLFLNIFLIGLGLGAFFSGARLVPAQPPKRPVPNIWAAGDALPAPTRDAFHQMLRDKALEVQPELKSVGLARREAAALISQPNYDQTGVEQALQRARQGEMHARGEIDAAFAQFLVRLTPQQRAALAEAMVHNRPNALKAGLKALEAEKAAAPKP